MTEITCQKKAFRELRFLELNHLADVQTLTVEEGSLPNLLTLRVSSCCRLVMMPEDGIGFLPYLKAVEIFQAPKFKAQCQRYQSKNSRVLIKEYTPDVNL